MKRSFSMLCFVVCSAIIIGVAAPAGCTTGEPLCRTPEQTADLYIKSLAAYERESWSTLVDPAFLEEHPGFVKTAEENLGMRSNYTFTYSGMEYSTSINGDEALVTVTGGTATITDPEGASVGTMEARDDFRQPIKMVKRGEVWYLDGAQLDIRGAH